MIDRPVAEVMAAARAAGIVRAVTVGTDLESSRWSAAVRPREHADVYAAVAIHPNDTEAATAPAGRPGSPVRRTPGCRAAGPGPHRGRGAGRDRGAGPAAAGGRGRGDRAGLLPGPRRARRPALVVPRAHQDRQAHRQGADDPRPGGARRRAAPAGGGGTAAPGGVPLLLRRRGDGQAVRRGRLRDVVRGQRDVRQRAAAARRRRGRPAASPAGRDRRAVPHPGAEPRPAQRARPGGQHPALPGRGPGPGPGRPVRPVTATAQRTFGPW